MSNLVTLKEQTRHLKLDLSGAALIFMKRSWVTAARDCRNIPWASERPESGILNLKHPPHVAFRRDW